MRRAASIKPFPHFALGGVTLVSVVVAYLAAMPSIWLDEASSIALARLPMDRLWSVLGEREANMGLYYVLLKGWTALGDGLFAMRALSLILAAAAVVLMYLLAALLFDRRIGIIAAALLGINGMFAAFATEVRGYMLVILFVIGATYCFARCVLRPGRGSYVAYAVVASVAVYSHLFAGFVIAAHAVSLVWLPTGERRPRPFAIAYAGILVLTAPLVVFAVTNGGQVGWIGSTTPSDLAAAAVVVSGGLLAARARDAAHYAMGGLLTLLYALLGGIALLNVRRYRSPWPVLLSITCLALPAALVLVISFIRQPIWHYRYFAIALPFAVLLAARGLQSFQRSRALLLGAAVCLLSLASNLACLNGCAREDWVSATSFVVERTQPGDSVAFYAPEVRTAFDYYAAGRGPDVVYPDEQWVSPDYERSASFTTGVETLEGLPTSARVWLVLSHDDIEGDSDGRRIEMLLEDEWGRPAVERSFEEVRVLLFRPRERDR